MKKEDFAKDWKKFLIDIGKSETEVAKELNIAPSNLNRKVSSGTIKYLELYNIVEQYGYTVRIRKEKKRNNNNNQKKSSCSYFMLVSVTARAFTFI